MGSNATIIESRNKSIFSGVVFQCVFHGDLRDDLANQYYFSELMEKGLSFKQWLYANGLEASEFAKGFLQDELSQVKQRLFSYADLTEQIEHCASVFYQNVSAQLGGLNILITGKDGTVYKCTVKNTVLIPNYSYKFLLCQMYIDARIDPLSQPSYKPKSQP